MRYMRKKRLCQGFVSCFLITYMCFIFLNVHQYNYNEEYDNIDNSKTEENDIRSGRSGRSIEDLPIPDLPAIPDISIIKEKVFGSF